MKRSLSHKETLMVASMLFGMFFGAGNLIFPIHMGQLAGRNVWSAVIGFVITGVGLPVLSVAALGSSHSSGLNEMASRVGKRYGLLFTCILNLTVGPLFAIPRCATTAFTVGFPEIAESRLWLLIFSAVFFFLVLLFALKPGKIMVWIGKYLNPAFLILFGALIVVALIHPMASVSDIEPDPTYRSGVLFTGCLEGYNTMDVIAGLIFGIVVVNSVRKLGVDDPGSIALSTIKAGVLCGILMAVIYCSACLIGAQSRGGYAVSTNGGIALAQIAEHYFGGAGRYLLAAIVIFACLKTAIGLTASISETFSGMFTGGDHYGIWAVCFCAFAFVISNAGLDAIIRFSLPVLELLYPLSITLVLLNLFGRLFGYSRCVFIPVTALTFIAAVPDLLKGSGIMILDGVASRCLPFYAVGLGWILPACVGLVIGIVLKLLRHEQTVINTE